MQREPIHRKSNPTKKPLNNRAIELAAGHQRKEKQIYSFLCTIWSWPNGLHHVSQHHQSRQRRQRRPFVPSHAHCSKNTYCNQILFFFLIVKVIDPKYYKYLKKAAQHSHFASSVAASSEPSTTTTMVVRFQPCTLFQNNKL